VKCPRYWPCEPCTRQGIACEFPARRRARQQRSQPRNNELIGRLARLEEILGKVDPAALSNAKEGKRPAEASSSVVSQEPTQTKLEPQPRKAHEINVTATPPPVASSDASPAPENETSSAGTGKYLSSDFWTNLCAEVDGIKQTLEQSSDEEEDDDVGLRLTPDSAGQRQGSMASSSAQSPPSTALIGSPSAASGGSVALLHPSSAQIRTLCTIYFANVDLCFKVLHRPTVSHALYSFASSPGDHLDPATEVLFFAIYFAAVSTLTDASCLARLGEERAVMVARYKAAFEVALARADYLNTTRLEPLQAFTVYICCLRPHKESKASWALTALGVRLARGLGLHKDGDGSRFSPYVAEMRRRVWWSLFVLDIRGVEDRGTEEPLITLGSWDIKACANVNDDDFGPETTAPLTDRTGPTDITLSLCTAMSSRVTSSINQRMLSPNKFDGGLDKPSSTQAFEKETFNSVQALESAFVVTADSSHLASLLAALVARIVVLRVWLMIAYPFQQVRNDTPRPSVSRANLLRTALSMLELEDSGKHIPEPERWLVRTTIRLLSLHWSMLTTWGSGGSQHVRAPNLLDLWPARASGWEWAMRCMDAGLTSLLDPQWHPLAVTLSSLCTQTQGETVDRAWKLIDERLPYWGEVIADTSSGTLWRPIRKLYKKAKAARMQAQMGSLEIDSGSSSAGIPVQTTTYMATPATLASELPPQTALDVSDLTGNSTIDQSWFSYPDLMLQDPGNWLAGDPLQNFVGTTQDAMDWSTWNEFVVDSFAGESAPSSEGQGGGVL
jgi:hypothetical protein